MARPRKLKIALPPHINAVRARGRDYYYFHPCRGTTRASKPIRVPGEPLESNGAMNSAWWEAYRKLAGEVEERSPTGTFALLIEA